jgi:hypothetical protein
MNWNLPPWLFRSAMARLYARAVAAGKGEQARELLTQRFQEIADDVLKSASGLPGDVADASRQTIADAQAISAEIGDLDTSEEASSLWERAVFSEPGGGIAVRVASLLRQISEAWKVSDATVLGAPLGLALSELVVRPLANVTGRPPLFPALPDPFTLAGIAAFIAAPIVLARGGKNSGTIAAALAAVGIVATSTGAKVYSRGKALR